MKLQMYRSYSKLLVYPRNLTTKLVAKAHATIERKGNLKAKKLKQMIAKLPSLSPSKPTLDVSPAKGINQLSVGVNKGMLCPLCPYVNAYNQPNSNFALGASAVVIIIGFIGNPVVVPLY